MPYSCHDLEFTNIVYIFRIGAIGSVVNFSRLTGNKDDDWIDRLNHLWSVVLLAMFAVVVTSGQFVGDPIHCWVPAHFTGAYTSYSKSICWISNTYYIPMDTSIPANIRSRQEAEITYYQWVPLILLFQALLFKLPNLFWRMCNGYAGVDLDKISSLAERTQIGSPEERDKNILYIAKYMDRWLQSQREYHFNIMVRLRQKASSLCCFWFGKRNGTYLIGLYLFIKMLYCANVVGQFFLLNAFMSMKYNVFGFEVVESFIRNKEWTASPRFPRVTLCDFEIRQLENIQRYTVQCVLPINLFNEKIFIFIWFFLFFVATMTFINYASWLYYVLFKQNRPRFVRKYLRIADEVHTGFDKKLSRKFADEYLRDDGIFALRVAAKNSSCMVMTDLVKQLWKIFKEDNFSTKRNNGDVGHFDDDEDVKEALA